MINKTISVIIAAYKAEKFIIDAIESVVMQKVPVGYKLDIIVGVDGCDKTWDVVSTLSYENVRFIKMERNVGTYITFNTMMTYTNPDFIVRFDADDIMLPNYIAGQVNYLIENEGVDITSTWSKYVDIDKRPMKANLGNGTFTSENGESRKGADGQFMMRKEVWDELGAFIAWTCSADTEFLTRASLYGFKREILKQFGYQRRVHENSLTRHVDTRISSDLRQGYFKIIRNNKEQGLSKEECHIDGVTGKISIVLP